MDTFNDAITFVKRLKEIAVEESPRGDMPPVVILQRDNKIIATVIAPEVNKHAGIYAMTICSVLLKPDVVMLFTDAHSKRAKPDQTVEEFEKENPAGSMQKACDEDGACERGEIVDVVMCMSCDKDGKFQAASLPYDYHGKEAGTPFKWLDEHPQTTAGLITDAMEFRGLIPDSMRTVVKDPAAVAAKVPEFVAAMRMLECLKEAAGDDNDFEFIIAATAMRVKDFLFFDMRGLDFKDLLVNKEDADKEDEQPVNVDQPV